jgi:hypothetical protein
MKAYKALIALDLKLALRNRSVIFFNYLFPLIFFFIFGQAMHAERGAAMTIVIPAPLLFASVITGWILYMPNVILIFTLAHLLYGMPWPQSMSSILIFITIAIAHCENESSEPATGPERYLPHPRSAHIRW